MSNVPNTKMTDLDSFHKIANAETVDDLKNIAAQMVSERMPPADLGDMLNFPSGREGVVIAGLSGTMSVTNDILGTRKPLENMCDRVRKTFEEGSKTWKEILTAIRTMRMSVTTETDTLDKAVAKIKLDTDAITALTKALVDLDTALNNENIKRILK